MGLARFQKENTSGAHIIGLKINLMDAMTFQKANTKIKIMTMWYTDKVAVQIQMARDGIDIKLVRAVGFMEVL